MPSFLGKRGLVCGAGNDAGEALTFQHSSCKLTTLQEAELQLLSHGMVQALHVLQVKDTFVHLGKWSHALRACSPLLK